jgi:hypothetical protein
MMNGLSKTDSFFWGVCLVVGQGISTLSSFFWADNGRHTINGSVLVILGMIFWAVGFIGLFSLFREKNPWYSRLGLLYAFYGCLGGIGFGFEGLYSIILGVEKIGVEAHQKFPLHMNLVLFWSGPAFPLTVLIMGILFLIRRITPLWIALLFIAGAISFPVSRILRLPWTAHVADFLLLIPVIFISWHFIFGKYPHEKKLES